MDTAAIIISIVALFAAGAAIYFQYVVSRDTRDHLGRFESEAHLLLGEIRGHTTETRDKLLDAAVARTREATDSGTDALNERIDTVERALREERAPSDKVRRELRELRSTVNDMRHGIPGAVQQAARPVRRPLIEELTVDRPPSSLGERAEIALTWFGRADPELGTLRASCLVVDPKGREFQAQHEHTAADRERWTSGRVGKIERFNYPDDFEGGDTKAPGRYRVVGTLRWGGPRGFRESRQISFDLAEPVPEPDDSTRI